MGQGDDRAAAINAIGFQLFRIKPFGWDSGKVSDSLQELRGFQLFRIKPFGWESDPR